MLVQLASNVWKINEDSNLYIIKLDESKIGGKNSAKIASKSNSKAEKKSSKIIVIDSCPKQYRKKVEEQFKQIADPRDVEVVLFTHFHYDHIGNFDMFANAKFYASEDEITFFKKDGFGAVLNKKIADNFTEMLRENRLQELGKIKKFLKDNGIGIFDVPGHTVGSVLYLYKRHKQDSILFSGDTYFGDSCYGRTDPPSSFAEKMPQTLKMLKNIPYNILCGGHDYV